MKLKRKIPKGLYNLDGGLIKAQQDSLLEVTLLVQNRAKDIAPYDTGTLRRSITSRFETIRQGVTVVGSPVPYARVRHYINKKNPQTLRYLERGFEENVGKIRDILKKHLARNIGNA